jgi:hypothetical protein
MNPPQLYRQLLTQLGQWIEPTDARHLTNCAEIVAAILESESAVIADWLPYLSHRDCQARSQMSRLSYFMHNQAINDERFYQPLISHFLQEWTRQELILTLDTSMFWDTYCLIEVCLAWGSIPLAQTVIKYPSATVSFDQYLPVLEAAKARLPLGVKPTLLADRGFAHHQLMQWLTQAQWHWAIRVKSNLNVTFSNGQTQSVAALFPPRNQVHLFPDVTVGDDIRCNLGTTDCAGATDKWAVLTNTPLSLQTFRLYGQRFGGIEPHFKDYKSATFELLRSRIRDPHALGTLLMMVAIASLLAIRLGVDAIDTGVSSRIDWHGQRGLSLLQLGLRQIKSYCHQALLLPILTPIPWSVIFPACASRSKRALLDVRIEFSKVVSFSF